MTPEAFLFDMDGTIFGTEDLWSGALCEMLAHDGHEMAPEEARRIILGRSWNSIYADVAARFPGEAVGSAALSLKLDAYYRRVADARNLLIPGSAEFIRRASAAKPCAIVSGSCRGNIVDTLTRYGLMKHFALIVGAEDVPNGKPAPDGFLLAARRLGADPGKCMVLEDSAAGVRAGKAAGMFTVALVRPDAPAQDVSPADMQVASLDDIRLD